MKKEDYDSCNINHPKQKMDDGDSSFKLCHSGLYFFISGNVDHCKQGQKLIVLVMAVRHRNPPPTVVAVPSPVSGLSPPLIHKSALDAPAPSPSKASSVSFGVVAWVGLMFIGFVY